MSRVAHPSEKVLAVAAIYGSLIDELHLIPPGLPMAEVREGVVFPTIPPVVTAALIEAATRLAMSTDTRSVGIMGSAIPGKPPLLVPVDPLRQDNLDGTTGVTVTDR
jgi:hypothetical protein